MGGDDDRAFLPCGLDHAAACVGRNVGDRVEDGMPPGMFDHDRMGDDVAEIDQGFSSIADNHGEVPWSVSRRGHE